MGGTADHEFSYLIYCVKYLGDLYAFNFCILGICLKDISCLSIFCLVAGSSPCSSFIIMEFLKISHKKCTNFGSPLSVIEKSELFFKWNLIKRAIIKNVCENKIHAKMSISQ